MKSKSVDWPRGPYRWIDGRVLYVSVPFTWNLPGLRDELRQKSWLYDRAVVGGPAVELMPGYLDGLDGVTVGHEMQGVLQRVNPKATRTTVGCTRTCKFCGIGCGKIEPGGMRELADWPNLPILCDNNLLAASERHLDKVFGRLEDLGEADFNQGLDARLLTAGHAERIARIKRPIVRLALDWESVKGEWERAFGLLRAAGVAKSNIRTYCLIGFYDSPSEAWQRCEWVESHGVLALPQWYHSLTALVANTVTDEQYGWGWTESDRTRIMGYYYQHRGEPPAQEAA